MRQGGIEVRIALRALRRRAGPALRIAALCGSAIACGSTSGAFGGEAAPRGEAVDASAWDGSEEPETAPDPVEEERPQPVEARAADDLRERLYLRFDRGPGEMPVWVPRGEELEFRVTIDLGVLGEPKVGEVTLSSGVEPYRRGLIAPEAAGDAQGEEAGWIRSHARGKHLGYELDHELKARLQPVAWPAIYYQDSQSGSENRRRQLRIGERDGRLVSEYRNDGHCRGCENREHFNEPTWVWGSPSHCKKCKRGEHRTWRDPREREVPPGTVDMLSAVYLLRGMVRDGVDEVSFPLLDKQQLWRVIGRRGAERRIEVPAGRFDCVAVLLVTEVPAGEPEPEGHFQGLFGLQGSIRIWFEKHSGMPVLIGGEIPVPVVSSIDVSVELVKHSGVAELPAGR